MKWISIQTLKQRVVWKWKKFVSGNRYRWSSLQTSISIQSDHLYRIFNGAAIVFPTTFPTDATTPAEKDFIPSKKPQPHAATVDCFQV